MISPIVVLLIGALIGAALLVVIALVAVRQLIQVSPAARLPLPEQPLPRQPIPQPAPTEPEASPPEPTPPPAASEPPASDDGVIWFEAEKAARGGFAPAAAGRGRFSQSPWAVILFGLVFGLAGLFPLALGIFDLSRGMASASWPVAPGRVIESYVSEDRDSDGDRTYEPVVRYEYTVNGLTYDGDRVHFGEFSSSDSGRSERIVARYPPGAPVEVHYRPDAPETSVLEPGFNAGILLPLIIGVVFIGVSAVTSFAMLRSIGVIRPARKPARRA